MSDNRAIWTYSPQGYYADNEISITVTDKGFLFEVSEEKAVDSYNSLFTCSCLVPWEEATPLLLFFSRQPIKEQPDAG